MKKWIIVGFGAGLVLWALFAFGAGSPAGVPTPYFSFTTSGSHTNEQTQAMAGTYATYKLFAGQLFGMTNMYVMGSDGYRYGGTNFYLKITLGNSTEGAKTWNVFGDGSTNYFGYDGAWYKDYDTNDAFWCSGLYIPSTYTGAVFMQIQVTGPNGRSFTYPLKGIQYYQPIP